MSSNSVCNHTRNLQIGLPLRGRPILLITHMITDRIGLHSVLLPLLTTTATLVIIIIIMITITMMMMMMMMMTTTMAMTMAMTMTMIANAVKKKI